jgi:hypothetical protein
MVVVQVILGTIGFIILLLMIHAFRNFLVWLCDRSSVVRTTARVVGTVAMATMARDALNAKRRADRRNSR